MRRLSYVLLLSVIAVSLFVLMEFKQPAQTSPNPNPYPWRADTITSASSKIASTKTSQQYDKRPEQSIVKDHLFDGSQFSPLGDALIPPDVPRGHNSSVTPGYYETSEYLIGKVAVGVIFLESNGSIDPSTENWNSTEESNVISEITTGLNWLAGQNPYTPGTNFSLDIHYSVPTSYEPINRSSSDEGLWISEAMTYLGYPGTPSTYFTQVRDYINDLRDALGTDWAYAMFIVDSSNDSDGKFADGTYFAYAYLGGPFLVMTYDNNGYGIGSMDFVAAHETCHIFYATDEYDGLTEYSGYLNVSDNEGSGDMMDTPLSWRLCTNSTEQLGWRDTDADGIHDIVDTFPDTTLNPYLPDPTTDVVLTYTGSVTVVPYPNNNPKPWATGRDVTINTITKVEYRVDSGPWSIANATDGAFDEVEENFTLTTPTLSLGMHTVETRGTNSVNNIETSYASDIVTLENRVIIDSSAVSDIRCDLGSTQTVAFHARWSFDDSDVQGGSIYINGTAYATNGTGWISFNPIYDTVGKRLWTVTGVSCNNITAYEKTVDDPHIIWDRLEVYDYGVTNGRGDVGTIQTVWVRVRYDYDDMVFNSTNGHLSIGGLVATWDTGNRYWHITVSQNTVTKVDYLSPSNFTDTTYGLTTINGSITQSIIWDRVNIIINVADDRINLGDAATLSWTGTYEYDGSTFNGSIAYNNTQFTYDTVGRRGYTAVSISDPTYGLTKFTINEVGVIFDKVTVTLSAVDNTIEVGSTASLTQTAVYQYDGTDFDGTITLNDTLTKSIVGTYYYTTESISGDTHGITAFESNTIAIQFLDMTLPVADAGIDQTVTVDTSVSFDASNSVDNVGIVSYEWDFGDGTTGTGITTEHTYTETGTYTVILTVKDAAGNSATDKITITVVAPVPRWIIVAVMGVVIGAAIAIIAIAVALLLWKRTAPKGP